MQAGNIKNTEKSVKKREKRGKTPRTAAGSSAGTKETKQSRNDHGTVRNISFGYMNAARVRWQLPRWPVRFLSGSPDAESAEIITERSGK